MLTLADLAPFEGFVFADEAPHWCPTMPTYRRLLYCQDGMAAHEVTMCGMVFLGREKTLTTKLDREVLRADDPKVGELHRQANEDRR